jgi:hypothetical protein
VKSITGNVLVSTPEGCKPVTADIPLKTGDHPMILEGGEAPCP